jgi:chromosome partitioning protein
MRIITISNHKGGCGKSTVAFNIAVTLAAEGSKILAVDLDFQGNLTSALAVDIQDLEESGLTSHRLMLNEGKDYSGYLIQPRPRLDLIPACLDADAEALLDGQIVSRDLLLKARLSAAHNHYDYCIIDTPPALRVPTLNALAIADLTIVPVESGQFALVGLSQLLRTIGKIRAAYKPDMLIMALSSIYTQRQNLDKDIREAIEKRFTEDFVFRTKIPKTVNIGEATALCKAVIEAYPESQAAFSYRLLCNEIKEVLDEQTETRSNQRVSK